MAEKELYDFLENTNLDNDDFIHQKSAAGPYRIFKLSTLYAWLGLDNKVDKVAGKGLSENDYTDADAAKVANVPADTNTELAAKESSANKGAAGGYAPLDGTAKIPAAYLPSYVDDVVEYADFASFPVTGDTGKLYVTLDTNKVYRWSGSAYVEISPSPGSTDSVPEGATNLYHTLARVLASVLTGLSTATNAVITASDTVLSALGKLQKQITDLGTTKQDKLLTITTQTASYTLVLADAGTKVNMNVASSNNLTVPPNSDVAFDVGTQIVIEQKGAGQTTLVPGSGVTLLSFQSALKTTGQYAKVTIIKEDTNTWTVGGLLSV